jgi:hypothetical protein
VAASFGISSSSFDCRMQSSEIGSAVLVEGNDLAVDDDALTLDQLRVLDLGYHTEREFLDWMRIPRR